MSSSGPTTSAEGGKDPPAKWPRMKWTDASVRLLISLAGTDSSAPCCGGGGVKGKWKAVSDQMLSRGGFRASAQQCEDKLNDLNKRFKRLADLLGPSAVSAAAAAATDPSPLLASAAASLPSPSSRATALKLLSSKQLFFLEMAALHSGLPLPQNPNPNPTTPNDSSEEEEEEEEDEEEGGDDMGALMVRMARVREERVEIEAEALELEQRRLKWERFRARKDRELERWRLENERMWLENEHMRMLAKKQRVEMLLLQ